MGFSIGNSKFSTGAVLILDPSNSKSFLLSEVEVLVVAGGGGGGRYGGGGGAGGVVYEPRYQITPGNNISVTVGSGGAGHPGDAQQGGRAADGQNSVFGTITAYGGGGGGNYNQSGPSGNNFGSPGGSGGGAGSNGNGSSIQPINGQSPGGSSVYNQGFAGGSQSTGYATGGGGGGGAGGPGENGKPGGIAGAGGVGKVFNTAGTEMYFAGGGGGGALNGFNPSVQVSGGMGGGGIGIGATNVATWVVDGQGGHGGGGGGGADNTVKGVARAGNGGSGVVIVRYPGQRKADGGGSIYFIDGYTVHIFSSGGTFSPYSSIPSNAAQLRGMTDLSGNGNSLISRMFNANRFSQPGSTPAGYSGNNAVSFSTQGTGTFIRLGHGQVFGGYKIRPSDCVYRYDLDPTGCHYHGNSTNISVSNYLRWTFEYYISPDAQYYPLSGFLANTENYGGSAISSGVGNPNNLVGIWQTVEYEAGPTPSTGTHTQAMFLYPGACGSSKLAENGYILYKNPTVEFYSSYILPTYTSSDKSMTFDGTYGYMARGNFPMPQDDFTISMWMKTSASLDGWLSYAASDTGGTDNEVLIYNSEPLSFFIRGVSASTGLTINDNTWRYITFTRSVSGNVQVYANGTLSTTITSLPGGRIRQNGSLVLGGEQDAVGQGDRGGGLDATQMLNGSIGGVEIYDRILNSQEILSNYNAQKSRFGL